MHPAPDTPRLVLGSTSRYRRELLERLGLAFAVDRPDVDESGRAGEAPVALVERLAREKALAVCSRHPGAWVLGSDQLAELDGQALGKPGGRDGALAQLAAMSGREVAFRTSVCLARDGAVSGVHLDTTRVRFRALSRDEIARYVDVEQPFDCAGSFKSEGRGIALFDAVLNEDPTALIGLPLIATARLLRGAGFELP